MTGGPEDHAARRGRSRQPGTGYEAFARESAPALRRLAVARLRDRSAAEDIVQDVLTDAYRSWDRLARYDDPLAWARRAVLNRSASRWRSLGREVRALARLGARPAPAPGDEPRFEDPQLWAAVADLSARQQEVVLLLWLEDLRTDEVASTLGCSVETVRTHWRRARERLARALAEPADRTSRPSPSGADRRDAP